jgi:hypothetical protein
LGWESVKILLEGQVFVHRDERIELVLGYQVHQFAVLFAAPTHEFDCKKFVLASEGYPYFLWQVLVKQQLHTPSIHR